MSDSSLNGVNVGTEYAMELDTKITILFVFFVEAYY